MCRYSLTQIAVDWRVYAADRLYYDVLFIGTGRPPVQSINHVFLSGVVSGTTVPALVLGRFSQKN